MHCGAFLKHFQHYNTDTTSLKNYFSGHVKNKFNLHIIILTGKSSDAQFNAIRLN